MSKIIIFVLILLCTPIGLFFGPSTMYVDAKQPETNPVKIKVNASIVGPEQDEDIELGNPHVKYMGTLLLSSSHPAFGGFSDLLVSSDRDTILAVTDMGFWMKAKLEYTPDGKLAGISESAQLGQLLNTEGKTYAIKYNADAEGLCRAPDSGYLVSFERIHRIHRFPGNTELSLAGKPVNFPAPKDLEKLPHNSGIEAMLLLTDNRLLILAEGDNAEPQKSYGAILDNEAWTPISYKRSGDYHPTSAGNSPDGGVFVLERRYKGPGTLGIRIRKFNRQDIETGNEITAATFMEVKSPLPRDNFEGLDSITTSDGKTYIYIISDDNFSPLQHTLLTLFEVSAEAFK